MNSVKPKLENKAIPSQASNALLEGVETTGEVKVLLITSESALPSNRGEDIVQTLRKLWDNLLLRCNRSDFLGISLTTASSLKCRNKVNSQYTLQSFWISEYEY